MELAELSPVAQNAATAKAITGEWDYPGFDKLLKELIAYDTTMDARVKRRKIWMIIAIFVCLVAFVNMIVLFDFENGPAFGVAGFVGSIANLIVSIRLWSNSKKLALPEAALAMVHQLAGLLRQDLDPKAKITTTIDLSGLTDKKKKSINPMQSSYLDPWCTIRFKLRDGYVAVVRQTDSFIETTRKKKNARGKTKTKTKWKKQCRVTARIIPPAPVKWGTPPKVDHVWERVKVITKRDLSVAVLDRWWAYKTRTEASTEAPPAKEIVGMLFRLCSMRPLEAK
jgi:hypothetical protein